MSGPGGGLRVSCGIIRIALDLSDDGNIVLGENKEKMHFSTLSRRGDNFRKRS
jgi:hypothetical protein